jgi:hypothetical protein
MPSCVRRVWLGSLFGIGLALSWVPTASAEPRAARTGPAELGKLVKQGGRAVARRDWDEAAHDFREAVQLAPDDARLRERLRRVLERRALAREARALHPPPSPIGFSDGPRDPGLVPMYKDLRWNAQLRREAFEARAEAEAARAAPDDRRLAELRRKAAAEKAEEDRLGAAIAEEMSNDEKSEADEPKAFEGIGGVNGTGGTQGVGGAPAPLR